MANRDRQSGTIHSGGPAEASPAAMHPGESHPGNPRARRPQSAAPTPSWMGKRVRRFKLVALLGQGAMGRVFRAEDTLLRRHVALKVLPQRVKLGSRTIAVERLIREARAAAALDHPHAVQIYEVNEAGDLHYIAMELVEGGSLKDLVEAAGPLDVPRACQLAAEAAEALAQAHTLGIIHRDIKPSNLMLTRSGRCKVADFGLARVDDPSDLTTVTGESVGTPQFVAPELLRGSPATARSDLYSLAATLWYLLIGAPPFEAATIKELLHKHLDEPLPDLRQIRPDLDDGLVRALQTALAKSPADRPASAEQFAKVLRVHTIQLVGGSGSVAAGGTSRSAFHHPSSGDRPALGGHPHTGSVAASAAGLDVLGRASAGENRLGPSLLAGLRRRLSGRILAAAAAVVLLLAAPAVWTWVWPAPQPTLAAADEAPAPQRPVPEAAPTRSHLPASPQSPVPAQVRSRAPAHAGTEEWVDLKRVIDPAVHGSKGSWRLEDGDLVSDHSGPAILEIPFDVPREYDFRIEFTSQDCVQQLLYKPQSNSRPGVSFNWCMGVGDVCGFESIGGRHVFEPDAPTARRLPMQHNVRHVSLVRVRDDGVQAFLDGQLVAEHKTDYGNVTRLEDWVMRDDSKLGLGTWNKPSRFHKVELIDRTRAISVKQ